MERRVKRQWLLIVSGTRANVIAQCESERIKFESLGWAILITSGMATDFHVVRALSARSA